MQETKNVVLERKATTAEQIQLSEHLQPYRCGRFDVLKADVWLAQIAGTASTVAIVKHNPNDAAVITEGIKDNAMGLHSGDLENVALFSTVAATKDENGKSRRVFFGLKV